MKTFEFWFDFGSPDLYLAFTQITSTKETLKLQRKPLFQRAYLALLLFL